MNKLKVFKTSNNRHKRILMLMFKDLYENCADIRRDPVLNYVSNDALLDHILEKIANYYNMIGESKYE